MRRETKIERAELLLSDEREALLLRIALAETRTENFRQLLLDYENTSEVIEGADSVRLTKISDVAENRLEILQERESFIFRALVCLGEAMELAKPLRKQFLGR